VKAVVLGGTTGMGRAIAQKLVERGDAVYLMGIDEADLAKSAADLRARALGVSRTPSTSTQAHEPGHHVCNLEEPATARCRGRAPR
jgi:NAD(P)-dependent dehydrogenase (short-subunit alcohol dehydrogenase family)